MGGKSRIAQQLLLVILQIFRRWHHRHLRLMLEAGLASLERGRQGEDLGAVLDGNHPPGGKTAAIP